MNRLSDVIHDVVGATDAPAQAYGAGVPGGKGCAAPQRILVYCHDLFGLGNVKRMLLFSHHLRRAYPRADVLFIMGSSRIGMFELPSRFDYIKLPEIRRGLTGAISSRTLDIETARITRMRSEIIESAVEGFQPDLLIIDKKPFGAAGELQCMLGQLPRHVPRILVCRDILDAPEKTREEMRVAGFADSVRRYYDQVLVLGEREIFDFGQAYGLPADLESKLAYCGYLAPLENPRPMESVRRDMGLDAARPVVLATVGGGEDGQAVLSLFAASAKQAGGAWQSVMICGPNLPQPAYEQLSNIAATEADIHVMRSTNDMASLIHASDAIVSMAGYNTVCGLMASRKPCILIPRTEPTEEQLVRAEILYQRGLALSVASDCSADVLSSAIQLQINSASCGLGASLFRQDATSSRIAVAVSSALAATQSPIDGELPCSA